MGIPLFLAKGRVANVAWIVGGNSPGNLGKGFRFWRRVCKDSFDVRVAEVVCGQLGYPAVKKVSYGTEDCKSAGQDCIKAPICNDYGTHTCTSSTCKSESHTGTLNPEDGTHTCTSSKSESHTGPLNPEEQPDGNPIIRVFFLVFFLITRNGNYLFARARYKTNLIIWAQYQVGFQSTATRRPSTGAQTNFFFPSIKLRDVKGKSGNVVATKNTTKPSPPILTELSLKKKFLYVLTLLLFVPISSEASEATNITCRVGVSFTSPNYPSNYPNGANEKWSIMAPKCRRILVTFTDFNVEKDDTLSLADLVDNQSSKQYTGEGKEFPPFLSKGNELEMTFISLRSGTRRGFNVSVSCYDHSSGAVEARIVGGKSPGNGFLELRNGTQSDDWRRVCKDGFDERVADVVCGELGYPAVRKVSYGTDDCMSAGQDCSKAPICNKYTFTDTFRLEDCSWSSEICSSVDAVKVECYEPGYKGCYDPEDLPQQNGFIFESTSQCVSSCRGEALAMIIGKKCFCSIADEVSLPDIAPAADHSTCIQNTQDTQRDINALVYDVSVGFCDELDDVIHGSRDSNITWFGSIVHLTCDYGYSLNGSGALQCVPGLSSYHPVWNCSVPSCDMLEATVGFCNQMDDVMNGSWDSNITWVGSIVNLTCDDGYRLNGNGTLQCVTEVSSQIHVWNGSIPTCEMIEGVSTGIVACLLACFIILLLIVCGVVFYCKKKGLCHMHNKSRETRNGHRRKRTTRKN